MTKQPVYQRLQKNNYNAALAITRQLKTKKALSEKTFGDLYAQVTGARRHGAFNKLMVTTKKFLTDHKVMTFRQINGLNLYVATQKCVHSKMENMFVEYQYVTNADLDKAIKYQELNNELVPAEIEGNVIAKNILGLTGSVADAFVKLYSQHKEAILLWDRHTSFKWAILGPVTRDIQAIRVLPGEFLIPD